MNGNVHQGLFFNPAYEDIMHVNLILGMLQLASLNKSQCAQCLKINHSSVDFNFLGIVAEISRVIWGI